MNNPIFDREVYSMRVQRDGLWGANAWYSRSLYRRGHEAVNRTRRGLGFRIARNKQ